MAEVSGRTLMMALQAVDAAISRFEEYRDEDGELEAGLEELRFAYSRAEMELKAAYLEARKSTPGLPPYEKLVKG
jgi:hypothetical protein